MLEADSTSNSPVPGVTPSPPRAMAGLKGNNLESILETSLGSYSGQSDYYSPPNEKAEVNKTIELLSLFDEKRSTLTLLLLLFTFLSFSLFIFALFKSSFLSYSQLIPNAPSTPHYLVSALNTKFHHWQSFNFIFFFTFRRGGIAKTKIEADNGFSMKRAREKAREMEM